MFGRPTPPFILYSGSYETAGEFALSQGLIVRFVVQMKTDGIQQTGYIQRYDLSLKWAVDGLIKSYISFSDSAARSCF